MKTDSVITVEFEDHGQDFLEWDICNGLVVGCRPFQAGLWCNSLILTPVKDIVVGNKLHLRLPMKDATPVKLKYPIAAVMVSKE